ncbi:MAG: PAS domain-containing protein [Acidobacteria bacterium]|nr:PAS domain-containing protein [Acidobacteriota bacterium]
MHSLLRRQLKRFFGAEGPVPPALVNFVSAVDDAYRAFDDDRLMVERSLDLSSTELLQANSEMSAIFSAFPDLFFRLDRDGRIVEVRGVGADLCLEPRDFVGRRFQDVPLPAVARQLESAVTQVRRTESLVGIEYPMTVRGREDFFEARLMPLLDGHIGALVRNITERVRVERELAEQKAFLRQVIDLAPSFIFAKDRQGRFTLVNRAVAEAYGTTTDELLGKTDADFNANPEEVEHFRRDDLEVMDTGNEKTILEEEITDAAGKTRLLQTVKRPMVSSDGRIDQVLGVATDITARKKLEEQLLQSQKMEAIGVLAGGVAHDFNNLLNVITGYTDMAERALETGHAAREHLERVTAAALRAADLTRKLLAVSRRQVLQVKSFDLGTVVGDFSRMLSRIVGEDVEVELHHVGGSLTVRADPGQLEQVLLNLCTNARQAMLTGGRLTVTTRAVSLSERDVAGHEWAKPGDYAALEVTDSGAGMDEQTMERIFEPFYTTKAEGSGLGLATVYGIVRQHDGFLRVESEPGRGTTFHVFLPLECAARIDAETIRPAAVARPAGGGETILVAEDEPMLRDLLRAVFEKLGYDVVTAENGLEAVNAFKAREGRVDLVVIDAVMPRMSGPDALREMRACRPGLRGVIVSGYAPESEALTELLAAGVAFVAKPFLADELARTVRELLDAQRAVSAPSPEKCRAARERGACGAITVE